MGRLERLRGSDCLEFKLERRLKDGVFVPPNPYKKEAGPPHMPWGKIWRLLQQFLRISHCPFRRVTSRCKYALSSILSIKNGCPVFVQRRSSLGRKQVKRETFIKIHLSAFNLHNPLVIFTGFCNVICYNFLYSLHIYVVYKHSFILCNNVKSIYCRY